MAQFVWRLTEEQVTHASNQFHQLDGGTGFLTGEQAREIFKQQGLPTNDLAQIWILSDYNQDGKLSEKEFTVAKFLIYARQSKQPLPEKLPEALVTFLTGGTGAPSAGLLLQQDHSSMIPPMATMGSQSGVRPSVTPSYSVPSAALNSQSGLRPAMSSITSTGGGAQGGAIPSAALSSQSQDKFAITQQQYQKYKETFDQAKDETGMLGGAVAIDLFSKSGLSHDVLAAVWQVSDINQDGCLNDIEFAIAMHLIHYKLAGGDLPQQAPPSLLNSAKMGGVLPSSSGTAPVGTVGTLAITPAPAPAINIPEIILPDISISVAAPPIPQFDMSPLNPLPPSELAAKYGISDFVTPAFDPTSDIQRAQNEVQNSNTAQQVLDQSDPELKGLTLKLESVIALQQSLNDKSTLLSGQLSVVESQRQAVASVMQDINNQMVHGEQELQQQYMELVNLKAGLEAYSANQAVTGDINALRQMRQQINHEQTEVSAQLEMSRDERNKLNTELELLKKEIERINAETAQLSDPSTFHSVGSLSGTMAGMSLMGDTNNMLGPTVNMMNVNPQLVHTASGTNAGMGMGMGIDPRMMDPRMMDPRMMDPRMMDPRLMTPVMDPRHAMGGQPATTAAPAATAVAEVFESSDESGSSEGSRIKKGSNKKDISTRKAKGASSRGEDAKKGKGKMKPTDDKKQPVKPARGNDKVPERAAPPTDEKKKKDKAGEKKTQGGLFGKKKK